MDYLERRVATLERLVLPLPRRVDNLLAKLGTTEQKIQGARAGRSVCVTTITGKIVGGLTITSTPMPDTSLQVKGGVTGLDYGTYPVTTGVYSIDLFGVDPADTSLDLYPFGPVSPRFNGATPLAFNQAVTRCTSNPMAAVIPPCAPGYAYLLESSAGTGACQYPLGALNCTDSRFGTMTSTLGGAGPYGIGSPTWLTPCFVATSFTFGVCLSVSTAVRMSLVSALNVDLNYQGNSSGCPVPNTCGPPTPVFNRIVGIPGAFISSKTSQPAFDLSAKFDYSWSLTNPLFHNNLPRTVRWYEP